MAENRKPCTVCQHESRQAIDTALVNGKSMRGISRDFRIGSTDDAGEFHPDHKIVSRHNTVCLKEAAEAAIRERKVTAGTNIVETLRHLQEVGLEVIARSRVGVPVVFDGVPMLNEDGTPLLRYNDMTTLRAVREVRATAEVMARVVGDVDEDAAREAALAVQALENPEARKLLAQLDEALAADDQVVETP